MIGSGSTGTSESDNTDTNPGGGGSGGGGGSVVESSDVVVAPMVDQAADNGIASEDLCSSYSASGTVNGDVHTIKITAKDVMLHTNQQQVAGHWVGFGIPAAEGNEYYAGFGSVPADLGSPVSSIAERTYEVNGKTYNTVYFSGDTEDEYKNGAYVVVKNGDKTTTYNITFDVSFFKADVSVLTAIPEVILDAYDEKSLPIRHKTAEGLGLTAATDGTTVTLSGETTTGKLDATDEATKNGYLLYGFNVGSKLITQLGGTVTPNPKSLADFSDGGKEADAVSMNNAALLNIQIWDNGNSSFIKKTISLELKDAAGRVQDTVELTFDATGCKIEGQRSVTFKDAANGNTIQSISVENDGTVTLPSNPSKEGFKFLGWYSDEDTEFTAETHVTADMIVYAKWEKVPITEGNTLPTEAEWESISSFTLTEDCTLTARQCTVPKDKTLVIDKDVTLTIGESGTLYVHDAALSGEGSVVVDNGGVLKVNANYNGGEDSKVPTVSRITVNHGGTLISMPTNYHDEGNVSEIYFVCPINNDKRTRIQTTEGASVTFELGDFGKENKPKMIISGNVTIPEGQTWYSMFDSGEEAIGIDMTLESGKMTVDGDLKIVSANKTGSSLTINKDASVLVNGTMSVAAKGVVKGEGSVTGAGSATLTITKGSTVTAIAGVDNNKTATYTWSGDAWTTGAGA